MSVIIKGMDIQKQCSECRLCEGETMDGLCHAAGKWFNDEFFSWYLFQEDDIDDSKPLNCPLGEVSTPHGRLIDADALYKLIDCGFDIDFDEVPGIKAALLQMIIDQPTVIEAEAEE